MSSELEALQEGASQNCRNGGYCSSPQPLAGNASSPATDLAGDAKRRCGRYEQELELAAENRRSLEHGAVQQLSSKSLGNESSLEGTTIEALLCARRERAPRVGTGQAISAAPAAANRGRFASAARRARLGQPRQVPNTSRSHDHLHSRGPVFKASRRGCTASPPSLTSMGASISVPIRESETASPVPKLRSPVDSEGQHAAFLSAYARHMQGFARKLKRSPRSSSW